MKKSFLILLALLAIAASLAACGGEAAKVNPNDPKTDVSAFKIKDGAGSDMPDMIS